MDSGQAFQSKEENTPSSKKAFNNPRVKAENSSVLVSYHHLREFIFKLVRQFRQHSYTNEPFEVFPFSCYNENSRKKQYLFFYTSIPVIKIGSHALNNLVHRFLELKKDRAKFARLH